MYDGKQLPKSKGPGTAETRKPTKQKEKEQEAFIGYVQAVIIDHA